MADDQAPQQGFALDDFLPYLLNQAAEGTSKRFFESYRNIYGMTRTQWRVMANLGRFGAMSAAEICRIAHVEKTKVSRAVAQLESLGFLERSRASDDRRRENLRLTRRGRDVFEELGARGLAYQAELEAHLGGEGLARLKEVLKDLIALSEPPSA